MTNKEPILFPSFKNLNERIAEKKQEFNSLRKQISNSYKELERLKTDIDKLIKQKKKLIDSKCSLNKELFYIKQAVDNYEDFLICEV